MPEHVDHYVVMLTSEEDAHFYAEMRKNDLLNALNMLLSLLFWPYVSCLNCERI